MLISCNGDNRCHFAQDTSNFEHEVIQVVDISDLEENVT